MVLVADSLLGVNWPVSKKAVTSMMICVYVIVRCSSERRLGDLEVALTLEDLGAIVQPTVQLNARQKSVSICAL